MQIIEKDSTQNLKHTFMHKCLCSIFVFRKKISGNSRNCFRVGTVVEGVFEIRARTRGYGARKLILLISTNGPYFNARSKSNHREPVCQVAHHEIRLTLSKSIDIGCIVFIC